MTEIETKFIQDKIAERKEYFTKRDILWYLVFLGFAVNYMTRINLNIAIVSMVQNKPKTNGSSSNQCFNVDSISDTVRNGRGHFHDDLMSRNQSPSPINETANGGYKLLWSETTVTPQTHTPVELDGLFAWNEYHQGLVLGSFFWLHWATQLPGGLLAQVYGTKLVFGLSNFVGILICFLIPTASYMGYEYLIILRVVQGIITGFSWPAMHTMAAKWIPPNERSKFVTAYLGSSVGAALTFPMCGYIIAIWGWELVFYVSGVLGTLWYVCWCLFVFDSPAQHPTITKSEREYITSSLGHTVSKEKAPVPWIAILTSLPMWMGILAQWGGIWGLFTLMTHAPTYIKFIHGMNIKATGIIAGIPHVLRMLWALVFSQFGDYLLRTKRMSRTNVRKLATAICCMGQGCFMMALAHSGCNYTAAIVFMTAATAIHGAVSTGPLASFVDLSPNYAGVQLGLSGMISVVPGFLSPIIVSHFTYNNQTVDQWQKVFWIATGMLMVTGLLNVLCSSSELQWWNSPETAAPIPGDSYSPNKQQYALTVPLTLIAADEDKLLAVESSCPQRAATTISTADGQHELLLVKTTPRHSDGELPAKQYATDLSVTSSMVTEAVDDTDKDNTTDTARLGLAAAFDEGRREEHLSSSCGERKHVEVFDEEASCKRSESRGITSSDVTVVDLETCDDKDSVRKQLKE